MEVKIGDGRRDLYQWDTGQFLIIEGPEEIQEVHFCYSKDEVALICRVRQMDARSVVEVPNILLQEEGLLNVYLYYRGEDGTVTKEAKTVTVTARPRPADYVYTETEVWHYIDLENRVNQLEAGGIADAVNAYLQENPVEAGATEEEAAQIQQNREEIEKVSAKSSALEDTTAIVCAESGDVIAVRDSSDRPLRGLRLFGKTRQNGTPSPDNPVELVSAGASGAIHVTVTDGTEANVQTLTASTPNGLNGIPVSSGGNYTDENGQQWICDEIDFARGVYIQRCYGENVTFTFQKGNNRNLATMSYTAGNSDGTVKAIPVICDKLPFNRYAGATNGTGNGIRIDETATNRAIAYWNGEVTESAYILYQLAEPIETPLPVEELEAYAVLHTNKPNTTVYNDAGAGIGLEYVADTKNYIDQKLAAISAAMLNT